MKKIILTGVAGLFASCLFAQTPAVEKKEAVQVKPKTENAAIQSERADKMKSTEEMHSDAKELKANRDERTRMEKQYFADRKKLSDTKLSNEEKTALETRVKEEKAQMVALHRKENAKQMEVKQDEKHSNRDSKAIENAQKAEAKNNATIQKPVTTKKAKVAPHTVNKPRTNSKS